MFYLNTILSRIMGIGEVQRQSIVSFIWQIAFTFIGFLSTMYFARVVGAGVLGAYFLFVAYYSIIGIISDGGFGVAATKRISEGEEPDAYFSAFVLLRSIFVTISLLALITLRSYFVDLDSEGIFVWLIVALTVSLVYGAVSSGIAGRGKMGIHATCGFINNVSRIIVQVAAVFLGFGVAGLAGGFVCGMVVGAIVQFHFFDLHFVRFGWRHIKSLSTFSFWIFLTSSGVMMYTYADRVIIGYYLSNADVGIYFIALQLAALASFTTLALRSTLWPKVSRWGKIDEIGLIEESLSRAFSYSLILAVPVVAGGILLGDKLLYFFYGAEFAQGYATLAILLIVQIVNIFQFFFTTYLGALDRQKDAFKATAVAAAANIVLNLILIPVMGIDGAAIATLVSMVLNAVLARRALSQIITIRVEHGSLINILIASGLMSLLVGGYRMFVPLSNVWLTLVPVVLGGVVYGILILKFDKKICNELKGIATQMNVPLPDWLR
jgi:O-antigen/teichoic acid export membrane protein